MKKVNHKLCNVNKFSYDKKTKILSINYKFNIKKTYNNISNEQYEELNKLNLEKKTIGLKLRKILKDSKS